MTFPQTITASQANKETPIGEMFASLKWASTYTNDPLATAGLARGYNGGRWGGFDVADVAHTFGASVTTYVCVDLAVGTLNFSTSSTNYLDTANFAPVETVVSGASSIAAADVTDDRTAPGGVWNRAGVAGIGDLLSTNNLSDVANAATARTNLGVDAAIAAAITALIGGAPGALDTLNELADALADDASFATTVTNALALKAPLASPALTGNPTAPTQTPADNSTKLATTAYVDAAVTSGSGAGLATVNVFTKNQSVAPVALTDAATIATDASLSNNFTLTMVTTGRVMGAPTNPTDGMVCNWAINSGAGAFTMTWASAFDFGGAGAPTHSVTASKVDLVSGYYHAGISKWLVSFRKGS